MNISIFRALVPDAIAWEVAFAVNCPLNRQTTNTWDPGEMINPKKTDRTGEKR
jgi:hypothetical protein